MPTRHQAPSSDTSDDAMSFATFRECIHHLVNCSCCGQGAVGTIVASRPDRSTNAFKRLGFQGWRETVKRCPPMLPVISSSYLLPDVAVLPHVGKRLNNIDMEIVEGRIGNIRPAGSPTSRPLPILERYRGMFVSAALIDMHTHFPPDNLLGLTNLFMMQTLRHGITIVRDAGDTDGTAIPAALAAVLSGRVPGPEIHYTYAFVNSAPARWSNSVDYDDPAQAEMIVADLRRQGATWVKSYENLDMPRITALKAAAERHQLGVMGHVPYSLGHEQALLPDAQHLMGVAPPNSFRRDHVLDRMIDWHAVDDARIDLIRRVSVEHGLSLTPTLNATDGILDLDRYDAACTEASAHALPNFYARIVWHPAHGIPAYRDMSPEYFALARQAVNRKHRLIRALAGDDVELRLGTDTQQPFVSPGVALHREVSAFVSAGVDRSTVIDMASRRAANALGLVDVGVVREGARADLMVSAADPAAANWDVRASLKAVIVKGRLTDTADLDAAIAKELGRFEGLIGHHVAHWLAKFSMHQMAGHFVN